MEIILNQFDNWNELFRFIKFENVFILPSKGICLKNIYTIRDPTDRSLS